MGANLKEKVAIVTGASRGLGKEYAKALAAAGAQPTSSQLHFQLGHGHTAEARRRRLRHARERTAGW